MKVCKSADGNEGHTVGKSLDGLHEVAFRQLLLALGLQESFTEYIATLVIQPFVNE